MANKRGETERKYPVPPNTKEHSITFMTRESDAVSRVYLTIQKIYLKDRGYNSNKRICIGRLDYRLPPDWKETGKRPTQMIPNENYSVYFPEYRWSDEEETASSPEESASDNRDMDAAFFSDNVKVGSYLMIDAVVSRLKLRELLASEFSDTEINRCLDLASYLVICGDDAVLHFSRYAYDHALFDTDGRADDAALNLSDCLDDDGISVFMRKWSAARRRKSATNRFYLFADGTQPTGQAGETEFIETGASESPGGQSAPNMMLAVDGDNGLPILYDMYGGPVNAPSEYAFMANRFTGMQDMVGAVLDREFISKEQIACLDQHGLACIIPAKGYNRLISDTVLKALYTFENHPDRYIPRYRVYGTTVSETILGKKRFVHIYYSPGRIAAEQDAFFGNMNFWEKDLTKIKQTQADADLCISPCMKTFFTIRYSEENSGNGKEQKRTIESWCRNNGEMSHELRLTGYSALITTEETDAETALTTYRRLAFGGRLNAASKAFLGDSSLRSDYRNRPKEKGFIIFLGMIIRQSIYLTLQQEAEKTKTAVPLPEVAEAIDELEKISVVRYANGRYSQRTPLTRVQKQILSAFGLDHSAVTGKIKSLAERLTSCAAEARKSPKKAIRVNNTCSI